MKIAVGLSGGVDSSLTARMLKDQGHEVIGLTMAIWDGTLDIEETGKHACFGPGEEEDIELARRLCEELEIPFHVVDLKEEYKQTVLDYFRSEYLSGRTPNPCVVCNHRLKFGFLLEQARKQGIEFDKFATGHYARLVEQEGHLRLSRAKDTRKDQTYFLWGLPAEQLQDVMFPLGDMTKREVRELAAFYNLEVATRPESQDFIDGGDYSPLFTEQKVDPGEIVDSEGNVLGEHKGIIHYTIGQRKGLGISSPNPMYVIRLDSAKNQVVVSDEQGLFAEGLMASQFNWQGWESLPDGTEVNACVRLSRNAAPAKIYNTDDGMIRLAFDIPQRAVAPGQSVVVYIGDEMVGGGIIEQALFEDSAAIHETELLSTDSLP